MSNLIKVQIDSEELDLAKLIAGELIAQFNQDLEESEVPFIVRIINKDKYLEVQGYYQDHDVIPDEEYLNAEAMIDETLGEGK
jgi:hypothetical protein